MKRGDVIRGYRIVSEPTNGGGGRSVWAFAQRAGNDYFLKQFLDPKWPTDSSMGSPAGKARRREECERFEHRHQQIAARLNPTAIGGGNLVTAIDIFREGTTYYEVTDRIPALGLDDLRGFTLRQIAVVLRTLCQSVRLLHRAGIVHGHLTPANVLLQRTSASNHFAAKVIGLDDAHPTGDRLATAVDIFALALIFHVYLSGGLPMYRASAETAGVGQQLIFDDELDSRMIALLGRMTAGAAADRPRIEEVITALADETLLRPATGIHSSRGVRVSSNSTSPNYAVDIVFCIDVTGSMAPVIEKVKEGALFFHKRLEGAMAAKDKAISQLRLRVIAYRDFGDNAGDAIQASDFWRIPEQTPDFEAFVRNLHASGGGDEPESGLEALALAIGSPWERGLDRRRHIIAVFTDASAHPLGVGDDARTYPAGIPADIDDLFETWGYASSQTAVMENAAKRLLLFAPDTTPWNIIAADWNNTVYFPSQAGSGLDDVELAEVVDVIASSV